MACVSYCSKKAIEYKLDENQQKAVNAKRNSVVSAGAGSGKSTTMAAKVKYLVDKNISLSDLKGTMDILFKRLFINTIKETVYLLKKSGVDAKAAQFDRGEYYEFIIRIPKEANGLVFHNADTSLTSTTALARIDKKEQRKNPERS